MTHCFCNALWDISWLMTMGVGAGMKKLFEKPFMTKSSIYMKFPGCLVPSAFGTKHNNQSNQ